MRLAAARRHAAIVVVGLLAVASSCTTSSGDAQGAETPGSSPPAITEPAAFTAHGSVEQAYVLGAEPGQELIVADSTGAEAGRGTVDTAGSLVVRDLPPGDGYTFRAVDGDRVLGSEAFRVLAISDAPEQSFYDEQDLEQGINYLTMRDGVQVAATLRLPQGKTLADGPFPTVIEYSGYAVAPPHDGLTALLDPEAAKDDPLVPSTSTAVGGIIAPLLGYATVSLQMRGSGCSGGAMGLFDLPTTADGYDVVEIVAAEPWVKGGKVGMVGISFSGISQMFVGGAQPPHLAALSPMSITEDLYSVGLPGAIYNDGFAASWLAERMSDAEPAPEGGQPWAAAMIEQEGDEQCLANQALRLQTQDVDDILAADPHRNPVLYDDRSPARWARDVSVPVFLVGALQDEQTGGQWPAIIDELAGKPDVFVTLQNGTHVDSLGPATITRWVEFLDLFVADQVPTDRPLVRSFGGLLYEEIAGSAAQAVPPIRFTDAPDLEAARAAYRQDPRVRVLFDNGGDPASPGSLGPQWEAGFADWPPPAATPTAWFLAEGGALVDAAPGESTVSFDPDPEARPRKSLPEGSGWDALPEYDWAPVTGSIGLGFVSAPLTEDVTVVGPASLDLTLASTAEDTDLQVTVSEVRPDGTELYVQSGFLRASSRALDEARSTPVHPVPTYLAADAAPLVPGEVVDLRIPILPISYAFRAGSQIRITVTAPGGDRPAWTFQTPATGGTVTDTVTLGGARASKLVLPVVPGLAPTDPQPACPSLRGQPCRAYEPAGNGG